MDAPQLEGTGEIRLESADRASGYFTVRTDKGPKINARTAGVYVRASQEDMFIMDGHDDQKRIELIGTRLINWKAIKSA